MYNISHACVETTQIGFSLSHTDTTHINIWHLHHPAHEHSDNIYWFGKLLDTSIEFPFMRGSVFADENKNKLDAFV